MMLNPCRARAPSLDMTCAETAWTCATCTLENVAGASVCEACESVPMETQPGAEPSVGETDVGAANGFDPGARVSVATSDAMTRSVVGSPEDTTMSGSLEGEEGNSDADPSPEHGEDDRAEAGDGGGPRRAEGPASSDEVSDSSEAHVEEVYAIPSEAKARHMCPLVWYAHVLDSSPRPVASQWRCRIETRLWVSGCSIA